MRKTGGMCSVREKERYCHFYSLVTWLVASHWFIILALPGIQMNDRFNSVFWMSHVDGSLVSISPWDLWYPVLWF